MMLVVMGMVDDAGGDGSVLLVIVVMVGDGVLGAGKSVVN